MNCTIVTMLIDINRESWSKYSRSYSDYLNNLSHLLSLDNNIVIFIEDKGIQFVKEARASKESKTIIHRITRETLPAYKYFNDFKRIIESEKFKQGQVDPNTPEMNNELYHLAVHNKPSLVNRIAHENPFGSDYFMWFDCGLGHSKVVYPKIYNPERLIRNHFDQISLIQLQSINPHYRDRSFFYKSSLVVFGGGFFGGSKKAISIYALEYDRILQESISENLIDDDQSITLMVYFDNPTLFHTERGDWYSAITQFNN
jgi:protein YibB